MKGSHTHTTPTPAANLRRFVDRYRPVFEALSRSATPFGSSFFSNH